MAKFYDECMDAIDWIEEVSDDRPAISFLTLSDLEELRETNEELSNHWDYPLSETEMLATDEDKADQEYVLVRFADIYGGYEYRWCEIDDFEGGEEDE